MDAWTQNTLMSNIEDKIESSKRNKDMLRRSVVRLIQHLHENNDSTFYIKEVIKAS
jgi:hypothetical protein